LASKPLEIFFGESFVDSVGKLRLLLIDILAVAWVSVSNGAMVRSRRGLEPQVVEPNMLAEVPGWSA
jgi:hypothetical protein